MIAKINHITLTTRHARVSPRTEVSPAFLAQLVPMLIECEREGIADLPGPDGLLTVRRLTAPVPSPAVACWALGRSGQPSSSALVTLGVALEPGDAAAALWRGLCSINQPIMPVTAPADRPAATPWLAVIPHLPTMLDPGALQWLGDAERCIAWAWIASIGR